MRIKLLDLYQQHIDFLFTVCVESMVSIHHATHQRKSVRTYLIKGSYKCQRRTHFLFEFVMYHGKTLSPQFPDKNHFKDAIQRQSKNIELLSLTITQLPVLKLGTNYSR